jgi:DNA repair photolyase
VALLIGTGCVYCYARPSHGHLGLSAGLDFETKIFVKAEAASLLRRELARPGYVCRPISLGANTDPYQPLERRLLVTRRVLEVLAEARHPVGIVTKSALVTRDLDLLRVMARDGLVRVYVSVTTLDRRIARTLEPRATAPHRRLEAVRALAGAGVTTGVMVAPIVPALTDPEIEAILEATAKAGASSAGYVLVRLPHEVKELFRAWLEAHHPARAGHVLSLVRQCRDGRLNDPGFGSRMRGEGVFAELVAQRFRKACARLGLDRRQLPQRTDLFRPPRGDGQLGLFGG